MVLGESREDARRSAWPGSSSPRASAFARRAPSCSRRPSRTSAWAVASSRCSGVAWSKAISFSVRIARIRWSGTPPRMMSVPRPAMLVAMVTAPKRPAWATISASRSWYFAFRTTCLIPAFFRSVERCSDFSMEMVPTRTGRPDRVQLLDLGQDRLELLPLRPVDHVGVLDPDQGPVRGDRQDLELVDLVELGRLGLGGAGHARELLVHPEVVLEGDGREGLVLPLDLDLLLGLHGLVEAVGPAPSRHQASRELVDDHDLAVVHHVVHVALEEGVGAQSPGSRGGGRPCWSGRRGSGRPGASRRGPSPARSG